MAVLALPPPLSLSTYLGALAGDLGCFPLDNEPYRPLSHSLTVFMLSILSLLHFGTALAARNDTVLYPWTEPKERLHLNAFRGEPASSAFDWYFTPNHNSSVDFSTSVGRDIHFVSPKLHPGHG